VCGTGIRVEQLVQMAKFGIQIITFASVQNIHILILEGVLPVDQLHMTKI
jgi:hypothetical protein